MERVKETIERRIVLPLAQPALAEQVDAASYLLQDIEFGQAPLTRGDAEVVRQDLGMLHELHW
ncbi:hypothetical protein [Streptomyces sp. NPDC048425]|uniref:hypothetical protein n=1 Tax=Streptomyces sp. NPDC048425 TaxID=3365548 RepID=UPI003718A978